MVNLFRNNFRWLSILFPILILAVFNFTSNTGIDIFISILFLIGIGIGLFVLEKNQLENKWINFLKYSLFIVSIIFGVFSFYFSSVWISLTFIVVWFVFNLWIRKDIVSIFQNKLINGILWLVWLGFVPLIPILMNEIQTRFSEEEFFVAIQYIKLLILFVTLLFTVYSITRGFKNIFQYKQPYQSNKEFVIIEFILFGSILFWGLRSYQNSFYPKEGIQLLPGITEETPFICEVAEEEYPIEERDVFSKAVKLLIENPNKSSPEYGLLSLVRDEIQWQNLFHDTLLEEAAEKRYTQPANSVKYGQFEAALRAYYYGKFIEKYPDAFSEAETQIIQNWFADINRRAMTVEWVDWLYGTAFSMWPEGPYENQEIGAGLISMLLKYDLSAPELVEKNISYMERNQRGWAQRFRNTDDAFVYQTDWISNAYLQSEYIGKINLSNMKNSFEWVKLQTMPDGSAAHYNFPYHSSVAGAMLLGYQLTSNPEYLWLADHALDRLVEDGLYFKVIPGIDKFISGDQFIKKPNELSCILYGNSGLPNQQGPLSPDKIILRNGWDSNSTYLLLNLRFTGWHRYKSTNTLTTVFQSGQLIEDNYSTSSIEWLPEGRSKLRDKRIPRENMNGFVIERDGVDRFFCDLLGCDSIWAQDPPFYGKVEGYRFEEEQDDVTVSMVWNGMTIERKINFYDDGMILIWDSNQEDIKTKYLQSGIIISDKSKNILSYDLLNMEYINLSDQNVNRNEISIVTIISPEELNTSEIMITPNELRVLKEDSIEMSYPYEKQSFKEIEN
ncbi:MAG: hypothetical protein CL609_09290 [Anaerolineaceae bacterium]|nr:hypothetical protein [Anaerolineaceae bacterium]